MMTTSLLFSQRKGLTPVRTAIQVDSIDSDLRNGLWNAVTLWQRANASTGKADFEILMKDFWLQYFKRPLDQFPRRHGVMSILRNRFFDGEWYECYDILEFIASKYPRNEKRSDFIENCNKAFEEELGGYRFIDTEIVQVTSESEIESIEESLSATEKLKPVNEHLTVALSYLSDRQSPDYRNSIKEAISAVESLCNLIAGDKSTLGEALSKVEQVISIHPALKKAFSSIYGYTSDASGIRHAMLDSSNLAFEDAKFMLVSCSAFINYLLAKATKAQVKI